MVEVGKGLRSTSKSILWQNCCSEGLMMDGWKRLIFGLVVCAAGVGVAANVPQAWINAVVPECDGAGVVE